MNINQRLKMLRKEMGLNQKDFGAKIGLGQGAVSWIEKDGKPFKAPFERIIIKNKDVYIDEN